MMDEGSIVEGPGEDLEDDDSSYGYLDDLVVSEAYLQPTGGEWDGLTICMLKTSGGYVTIGEHFSIDPAVDDDDLAENKAIAKEDAMAKLQKYVDFALASGISLERDERDVVDKALDKVEPSCDMSHIVSRRVQ